MSSLRRRFRLDLNVPRGMSETGVETVKAPTYFRVLDWFFFADGDKTQQRWEEWWSCWILSSQEGFQSVLLQYGMQQNILSSWICKYMRQKHETQSLKWYICFKLTFSLFPRRRWFLLSLVGRLVLGHTSMFELVFQPVDFVFFCLFLEVLDELF